MHPEYRAQWETMGYKSTMGSAEVVPPPPKEYRRVYHLTSAPHGISDISLRQLKVARFSNLNDPFELMAVRSQARYREERADANEMMTRIRDRMPVILAARDTPWSRQNDRLTDLKMTD